MQEFLTSLLTFFFLAACCALFVHELRSLRTGQWPLPPQRRRAVPWSGLEVCLAILIVLFLPVYLGELLLRSGFLDRLYDLDFTNALELPKGDPLRRFALSRFNLWAEALAFPFRVGAIVFIFLALSGTRPYQLGLTTHRGAANALVGLKAWVVVTPLVFLVNIGVNLFYRLLVDQQPDEHPITRLVEGQPLPVDWVLLVYLTLAAAPVLEEFIFRGILQPWFARRAWGGDAALAAALVMALLSRGGGLIDAVTANEPLIFFHELGPALFVLALVPGYFLVDRFAARFPARRGSPKIEIPPAPDSFWQRYRARLRAPQENSPRATARALYGTAALFAAVHSSVWPSPIPLFVLALALGWLAYRTQSLVAPIVLHALFNSITCALLILTQLLPAPAPEKGKETTSAARRPPCASTSNTFPGSWWPRRR
jgi:membrane protease YdiL (CAAX protease family)